MRISTNQLYDNQTQAMLNNQAIVTDLAGQLSSGKQLNKPSDNPLQIAQVLSLRSQISEQDDSSTLATIASNTLSTTDGSLSILTDIMQQANTLAVQGASDTVSPNDRKNIANQMNQLLNEAIGVANTKSNGVYVFGGSSSTLTGPVTAVGSPPSSVQITGNNQVLSQTYPGGQTLPLSTSLQQAFNVGAADGSKSVFDTLIGLRDAFAGDSINVQSLAAVNTPGTVIGANTTLGAATFANPLTADSSGKYSLQVIGPAATTTLTFTAASTIANVVSAINGSGTGVTAAYDTKTEKFTISSSSGTFKLADVASPGATNTANMLATFGLPTYGSQSTDISARIADVKNALQVALNARSAIGVNIQALTAVQGHAAQVSTANTASLSTIEDTNIQSATTQFSLAQTALQAAYLATSKLESSNLFNYVSTG